MELGGIYIVLMARFTIVKIIIISVEGRCRGGFEGPVSNRFGNANSGLKRPAVRTNVYYFIRFILAEWGGEFDRETGNRTWLEVSKLLHGKCRGTIKFIRKI